MGRFYKTAKPTFIDSTRNPNLDLQLMLANSEVKTRNMENSLNTLGDLTAGATFDGYKPALNKELENMNSRVDEIVANFNSGNKADAFAAMGKLRADVKKNYTEGNIAKMTGDYSRVMQNYQAEMAALKGASESDKGAIRSRANRYLNVINGATSGGFEGQDLSQLSPFTSKQAMLKEIDADKVKQSFKTEGNKFIVKDGEAVPVSILAGKDNGGKYELDGKTYDVMTSKGLRDIGVPFKYSQDMTTVEGYNQGSLRYLAEEKLTNSPGYMANLKDDYELFGGKESGKDFAEFSKARIAQDVQTYMVQHPSVTKLEESSKIVEDSYSKSTALDNNALIRSKDLANYKDGFKKDNATIAHERKRALMVDKGEIEVNSNGDLTTTSYTSYYNKGPKQDLIELAGMINAREKGERYDKKAFTEISRNFSGIIGKNRDRILNIMGLDSNDFTYTQGGDFFTKMPGEQSTFLDENAMDKKVLSLLSEAAEMEENGLDYNNTKYFTKVDDVLNEGDKQARIMSGKDPDAKVPSRYVETKYTKNLRKFNRLLNDKNTDLSFTPENGRGENSPWINHNPKNPISEKFIDIFENNLHNGNTSAVESGRIFEYGDKKSLPIKNDDNIKQLIIKGGSISKLKEDGVIEEFVVKPIGNTMETRIFINKEKAEKLGVYFKNDRSGNNYDITYRTSNVDAGEPFKDYTGNEPGMLELKEINENYSRYGDSYLSVKRGVNLQEQLKQDKEFNEDSYTTIPNTDLEFKYDIPKDKGKKSNGRTSKIKITYKDLNGKSSVRTLDANTFQVYDEKNRKIVYPYKESGFNPKTINKYITRFAIDNAYDILNKK